MNTCKVFIMFISFFSITMRKERNEPKKEKHVELRQCFALQDQMDDVKIFCHPELAAKSVETKSKRDFMPLTGVSGA